MSASVLLQPRLAERAAILRQALARSAGVDEQAVRVIRAPYRLCPLGAHVDHQYGPVSALALEQALLLAYVPAGSASADASAMVLDSHDFPGRRGFDVRRPGTPAGDWADYARGAARALASEGALRLGIHGLVDGGLRDGGLAESGLSSSAAVGVAWLMALADVNHMALTPTDLVRAQGRIEQGFLGLDNGLLDPAAVVFGQAGTLTRIDTRTLAHACVSAPVGSTATFLAISSGQRAALVSGTAFNARVAECREAARLIAAGLSMVTEDEPGLRLGDLPRDALAAQGAELSPSLARRVRHFLTETERVELGMDAWARGDLTAFGEAMRASAQSSMHDYETGSAAMIDLLDILDNLPGVYGARFSGAGYRGCCVALVERAQCETIAEEAQARYALLQPELAAASFALASDPAAGAAWL